ncbi:MAG: hypothetical protein WED10_06520 [Brumimicrobium sp.]
MYNIKLFDIIIQSVAIIAGITLWAVFGAYGYLYWILICLNLWVVLSSIIHIVSRQKINLFRIFFWCFYALLFIVAGSSMLLGTSIGQINFYFSPFSFFIAVSYFILTFVDFQSVKSKGKESLDF